MKYKTQSNIRLLVLIICILVMNKVSISQDTTNVDSLYLSAEEIEYLNQIEILTTDTVEIDFEGEKVLFITEENVMISKKDFFDSKVKRVFVAAFLDPNTQNSTAFDLMIIVSMKDLKRRVRRKFKNDLKFHI